MKSRFTPFENDVEVKKEGKLKGFFKKKPVWITLIAVGVLVITAAVYFLFFFQKNDYSENQPAVVEKPRFYSPLTGSETSEERSKRPVTAVIIENSPEARPQSGLFEAGVVFEAVTEGGITRFIALFQDVDAELIGPVRSVRPYYIEWAYPFDAAIAHVGGSDEALAMIRSGNYGLDIDEYFAPNILWRADNRYAPHDVYTSTESLLSYETEHGKTGSKFVPWTRQDGKAPETTKDEEGNEIQPEIFNSIQIPVGSGQFGITYQYDISNNKYLRHQGGEQHLDHNNRQIAPDVVVAVMVSQSLSSDGLHNKITTTGSGIAYIFQNGSAKQVTWERGSVDNMIIFRDSNGDEIKLNRGQVWISAVPNGNIVSWQ